MNSHHNDHDSAPQTEHSARQTHKLALASLIVSTIFIRRVYRNQIKPMFDAQK